MKLNDILNKENSSRIETDPRVRKYVYPKKVLWVSKGENHKVVNEKALLEKNSSQISVRESKICTLSNKEGRAGLLLDFGFELQGGIRINIVKCGGNSAKLRVRFGESAMEAMADTHGTLNATNDHAIRDTIIDVSDFSMNEFGNTGFRFVRIDLLGEDTFVEIQIVKAVFIYRDIEYKGEFKCSDKLLNKIWKTGAYTVHLNMQGMLWDGIKRDRLVWAGDMHPEIVAINSVFGENEVIKNSLDHVKNKTPLPQWMNGIPTYSMWWVISHYDLYLQTGDQEYLNLQKDYLLPLLNILAKYAQGKALEKLGRFFLDWPSSNDKQGSKAGVYAVLKMALDAGFKFAKILQDEQTAIVCKKASQKLRKDIPKPGMNKQAAALQVMAGLLEPKEINNEVLAVGGAKGMSTFMSYYILTARAMAGDINGSLNCIRDYYGAMLKAGATTFWEDFNIDWMVEGATIEEIVNKKEQDIHGNNGDYCYKGYRHSLCHGWSAGPTPWLSQYVLGIRVLEEGCKKVEIKPNLGDLEWAKGKYPTPYGMISVKHKINIDGTVKSKVEVPNEIELITEKGYNSKRDLKVI